MVDLVGSPEAMNRFKEQTISMLGESVNSSAYWLQFKMLGDQFAADPKITDKKSILPTLFTAAKLMLNPSPQMRQIWFIPYKGKLTYQIGYIGMITLADRAGISVRANRVLEKDEWKFFEDEKGQHFLHRENFLENNRGRELFAYSVFTRRDTGFAQIHTMRSSHIDDIKNIVLARMGSSMSPWKDPLFEPEMRIKTCIRRHSKYEPFSVEMASVIKHEEENEIGNTPVDFHEELEGIIDQTKSGINYLPDPKSEEGKKLSAELDVMAAQQERLI
jgi:phage RecT family recombinase